MSRQNKVNPGMYTQRGRLAQDDAAREIARQRSIGSQHTWQPVQQDAKPRPKSQADGADGDAAVSGPAKAAEKKPARMTVKAKAAQKTTSRKTAKPLAKATTHAKKKKRTAPGTRARAGLK